METKTQDPEEEKINLPERKRSYWEFGIFIAVVVVLSAVVIVLAFLVFKTFADSDRGKASIQEISKVSIEKIPEEKTEKKIEEVSKPEEKSVQTPDSSDLFETAIKILNGGAVSGSAGKVKTVLAEKGYKKIEVGNSDKSGYVGVTVFYQAEEKTVAERVAADLKAKYPTVQTKLGVSVEEKSGPIVIILGK